MRRTPAAAVALLILWVTAAVGLAIAGAPAAAVPPFVNLPADQGAHPAAGNEWWYTVGHLDADGRRFGFEIALYRFTVDGVGVNRGDVAITDVGANRFHQSVQFSNDAPGSTNALDVTAGMASLRGSSPADMHLVGATADGSTLDLHLTSLDPPLPASAQGFVPLGNGFSYDYSLANVRVSGSLRIDGTDHAVTGVAWQEHQWGDWSWDSVSGWTYMTIQLDHHTQLALSDHKAGRPQATLRRGKGTIKIATDVQITPTGSWKSPHSGAVYDSGWKVRIPTLGITLRVDPEIKDQELSTPNQGPVFRYWEGTATAKGIIGRTRAAGNAYVELLVPPNGNAGGGTGPGGAGDLTGLT